MSTSPGGLLASGLPRRKSRTAPHVVIGLVGPRQRRVALLWIGEGRATALLLGLPTGAFAVPDLRLTTKFTERVQCHHCRPGTQRRSGRDVGMASGYEYQRVRLSAWTWRESLDLLGEVAASGPEGAVALAEQLRVRTESSERVYLAAALGDATGDGGIEELRVTARTTGPHTVDLRCASLLALAKRLHEAATADLVVGLGDRDRSVRDYALLGLAAWGDPSAWGSVLAELKNRVRRPSRSRPQPPPRRSRCCLLALVRT